MRRPKTFDWLLQNCQLICLITRTLCCSLCLLFKNDFRVSYFTCSNLKIFFQEQNFHESCLKSTNNSHFSFVFPPTNLVFPFLNSPRKKSSTPKSVPILLNTQQTLCHVSQIYPSCHGVWLQSSWLLVL